MTKGNSKVEYITDGETYPDDAVVCPSLNVDGPLDDSDMEYLAGSCASHLDTESGGDVADNWPITFELFIEGQSRGKFQVEIDYDPIFYATKLEAKP